MTSPFPLATIPVHPFTISHSDDELDSLKTLLRLAPLPQDLYENQSARAGSLGISKEWMTSMRDEWLDFDWKTEQDRLNGYPHFLASVPDGDSTHSIHFIGFFSPASNAVPIIFLHGWPGCFLEFLEMIPHLQAASATPLHIIIPSLPGFAYSSSAPLDRDFDIRDVARLMDGLMKGLGFDSYLAQGGDIGSFIAKILASEFPACKGIHLNFSPAIGPPSTTSPSYQLTPKEVKARVRADKFQASGRAYYAEHATRPSTMGFLVASSPVALLAWLGEKILEWTDPSTTPSHHHILTWLTLYWLTSTFPSSIYYYRNPIVPRDDLSKMPISKPVGFSWFPFETAPTPKGWVEAHVNLVTWNEHEHGGHFAATEQPEALARDVLEYVKAVWK